MPAQGQSTAGQIAVALTDDHALIRAGLRQLLDAHDGMRVVAESADVGGTLAALADRRIHVLVLDITLGSVNSLESLDVIRTASPHTRILVLSMHDDVAHVQEAFAAGADGYLLKEAAESDLVTAITTVAAGDRYVHPTLGAALAQAAVAGARDPLSEREREVVQRIALGHTNQEIAEQMFLSVRSVETQRSNAMRKLGADTRADLVRWALEHGLLGPGA